jgi:hypothetical protein
VLLKKSVLWGLSSLIRMVFLRKRLHLAKKEEPGVRGGRKLREDTSPIVQT